MMNVMNIVRTRVSMPSEATLLFCHCFVMDGSELIKSVGFQWESAVVCKLIFAVSPLLNRGVANFPIGGSSVSPLGACYWWCSEGFLSEAWVGIFHHAMVMPWLLSIPFFLILFEVFSKNWSCGHFKPMGPIWDDPTVIQLFTHINFQLQKPPATTQLLPPGDPAWPRCFSLLGSSGLHEPPPSQRLVLAMFWRDPPGFH